MFTKSYSDGTTAVIENGVIALLDADEKIITNSNVDYYFSAEGYHLSTDEEVADQYHQNFAE